VGSSYKIGKST